MQSLVSGMAIALWLQGKGGFTGICLLSGPKQNRPQCTNSTCVHFCIPNMPCYGILTGMWNLINPSASGTNIQLLKDSNLCHHVNILGSTTLLAHWHKLFVSNDCMLWLTSSDNNIAKTFIKHCGWMQITGMSHYFFRFFCHSLVIQTGCKRHQHTSM